jgi:RHS repeat-associated protein
VRSVYDAINGVTSFLTWDADGQLRDVMRPCLGDVRHHWWNEAGQMVAMVDNEQCGYYGYNADGERMYKLTGQSVLEQYNAGEQHFQMFFNDAVLYVNPYMVVTPKGYTKHYYNGSRRIAAQVGDLNDLPNDILDNSGIAQERIQNARSYMDTLLTIEEQQQVDIENLFVTPDGEVLGQMQWLSQCYEEERTLHTAVHCEEDLLESLLIQLPYDPEYPASAIYYYHSDHLGSASWITKSSGEPVQYIHYMPYGELWKNQQRTPYNERFKFTGKERDDETGYDFFGARYHASALPSWLSVDPLADKYPGISPYAYCNWNPIKYVDPDGKKIVVGSWYGRALAKLGFNNYEAKVQSHLQELKGMDPELNKMIADLENSSIDFHIKHDNNNSNHYNPNTKEIDYDPDNYIRKNGEERPPEAALAHELGHAENDMNGTSVTYNEDMANGKIGTPAQQAIEQEKRNRNELNSIYYENIVREKKEYPQRGYNYSAGD